MPRAYASSTRHPTSSFDTATSVARVSSGSSKPGPTSTASADSIDPRGPSSSGSSASAGREWTAASGMTTLSCASTDAGTTTASRPAPTRSAASPARKTAPGERREPPTTTTSPRDFFESPGSGRPHSRRRSGVTSTSLGFDIGVSRVHGDGGALRTEVLDLGEDAEAPAAALSDEVRDGRVQDGVVGREVQELLLLERKQEVEQQHDD